MSVKCPYVVPRSFHLLDELNMAEKGKYPDKYKKDSGFITLGLSDPEDSSLTRWNSSIIPPQGTIIGDRMYNVIIVCDSSYPDSPPKMKFCQKVHSTKFIDGATGTVNVAGLMGKWDRTFLLMDVLLELRTLLSISLSLSLSMSQSMSQFE